MFEKARQYPGVIGPTLKKTSPKIPQMNECLPFRQILYVNVNGLKKLCPRTRKLPCKNLEAR